MSIAESVLSRYFLPPPPGNVWTCIPNAGRVASTSFIRCFCTVGGQRIATWEIRGDTSFSSSSLFGCNSPDMFITPVTLPPGLARLATHPRLTGSTPAPPAMTIGIVRVARCAAPISGPNDVTMTSTLRLTNSAARAFSRLRFPFANRDSKAIV